MFAEALRPRRADLKHFQALAAQSDFIQQGFGMLDPLIGSDISFQEMAVADLSPTHENRIRPDLQGLEQMEHLDFSGTEVT